jgi:uncharacterized protein (TIGR03790 family)
LATLQPEELLLLVNRNAREGRELAEFYAQARKVPDGRILELDLPFEDDMSHEQFERQVVPAVRAFLREQGLQEKVRCIVTFYGVPLRLRDRSITSAEQAEEQAIRNQLAEVTRALRAAVREAEAILTRADAGFRPEKGETWEALRRRLVAVEERLERGSALPESVRTEVAQVIASVASAAKLPEPYPATRPATNTTQPAVSPQRWASIPLEQLQELRYDASARRELRRRSRAEEGLEAYGQVLVAQADYLSFQETESAFDSELAMLWWPDYPRVRFAPNLLNHRLLDRRSRPVLMVSRLDAAQPQMVRDLILASLRAERDGLRGRVVVDTRGLRVSGKNPQADGFAAYDESLRVFARLARGAGMDVLLDEREEVLPAGSAEGVALYAGWYSVQNYVPASRFVPGAVGYHIASFEMLSLRKPYPGWVPGLMRDGIAATVGAVSEPYLLAFPPPDEFFALLLTGKLTLAEVFWHTSPTASWRVALIGDPLYTPFRRNPAVRPGQLPPSLRRLMD